MSHLNFDTTHRIPLEWLTGIAKSGEHLLKDIRTRLQNCDLDVPRLYLTNNEIKKLESFVQANRGHRWFGDRRSLLAEYRRVWNLLRYALAETPQTALDLANRIKKNKPHTDAAARLRENLYFKAIVISLQSGKTHPKILKLADLINYEQSHGRKTLVICTMINGVEEISHILKGKGQIKSVTTLHSGIKEAERDKRHQVFNSVIGSVVVATATLKINMGLMVDTIICYNTVSSSVSYFNKIVPIPRFQTILLATDHPLDLGSHFCHTRQSPPQRKRKQRGSYSGEGAPLLPFHAGLPSTQQ